MSTSYAERFNTADRQMVLNALQQLLSVKLQSFSGISERLFRDARSGRLYLVFGGIGDWHGIKEAQLNEIIQAYKTIDPGLYFSGAGALVLAEKNPTSIDIFTGSLYDFIEGKDKLIVNGAGDYQFHHKRSGEAVEIRESGLKMGLLTSIPLENLEDGIDTVFEATEDIVLHDSMTDVHEALKRYVAVSPPERTEQVVYRVVRNPKIARLVKESKQYVCEVCGREPFLQKNGKPYAEADHIRPLGGEYQGLDSPDNMRCLCSQCHAVITHGSDEVVEELLRTTKWGNTKV